MKTRELTGKALDWAVASYADKHVTLADIHWGNYSPSTNWAQAGPIIDREWLTLTPWPGYDDEDMRWEVVQFDAPGLVNAFGPTALIAAMRCYVASKLGDNIDVPKEFL
jgi:hypothetical protein